MIREKNGYVPFKGDKTVNEGKGLSDAEFNKMFEGKKRIYRNEVRNVYKSNWIVETTFSYDSGLMNNMARTARQLGETELPVVIYTTDFESTIGDVETILDQLQMNWMQFQSHIAGSKPDGIAIERRALAKLATQGGAGEKFDPKEALILYAETGNIVFDGYDQHGNPLPWLPIKELKNGLSPAAFQHLEIMVHLIDILRNNLGLNPLTEGNLPHPRLGKKVAELAVAGSANKLTYLIRGYRSIYERVCKKIATMIPDTFEIADPQSIKEALGDETYRYFSNNSTTWREFGIKIEEGIDQAFQERVSNIITRGLDKESLSPEDALYMETEKNPYRIMQYLRKKSRENREKRIQETERKLAAEADSSAKASKAKTEGEKEVEKAKTDGAMALEKLKHELNLESQQGDFTRSMLLEKVKNGNKLNEMETKIWGDMLKTQLKGEYDIEGKEIMAESHAHPTMVPANN